MPLFPEPWRPDAAAIAALPDRFPGAAGPPPIRSTRKADEWVSAIHRAYSYVSARVREPGERAQLDAYYETTIQGRPDFACVRSNATFAPVAIVAYRREAAREIMRQAREIERETYAARAKGEHGGGLGRLGLQLLEWFAFTLWPKSGRLGMVPSLAHIAADARMSKASVVEAMKRLEAFGFLGVKRRRKRIKTPLGVKVVQATSAYTLSLARGLGALALNVFGKAQKATVENPTQRSKFRRLLAIRTSIYSSKAKPKDCTVKPKDWLAEPEYRPLLE